MMTFKDLKKLVELPSYKEQRVPTVKALEESGVSVVAEKILENPSVIRTPVVRNGKQSTLGYQPEVWKEWK